jgi:endonuclease G
MDQPRRIAIVALHVGRGHLAPLASFSDTPFAADTNLLSNITPQVSALKKGPSILEDKERTLAKQLNIAV